MVVAANRIVDMEEMWRQRELENKASRDNKSSRRSRNNDYREEPSAERDRYAERRDSNGEAASPSSSPETLSNGLKDEDLEKFLHSKYILHFSSPPFAVLLTFFSLFLRSGFHSRSFHRWKLSELKAK